MGSLARQLRFVFLGTVLVVAAFSTGINFLFFLVYLLAGAVHRLVVVRAARAAGRARRLPRPEPARAGRRGAAGRLPRRQRDALDQAMGRAVERVEPAGVAAGTRHRRHRRRAAASGWPRSPCCAAGRTGSGRSRCAPGDPFGLFTTEMTVGPADQRGRVPQGRVASPTGACPPRPVDGSTPTRRRFEASSPLITGIRPYNHGDAINRIHWLSSVRHGELQVKEFDLEQTADLWLLLDLERAAHAGVGDGGVGGDGGHRGRLDRHPDAVRQPRGGPHRLGAARPHPQPRPRPAGGAEDPAPARQRAGRWCASARRGGAVDHAPAAPRDDPVPRHRLDGSRVDPRPGHAAAARRRACWWSCWSAPASWVATTTRAARSWPPCGMRWPSTTSGHRLIKSGDDLAERLGGRERARA